MRIRVTKNFASSYITWVNPRTLFFLLLQFRGLCSWDILATYHSGLTKQHASFVIFFLKNQFQCWHIGKSLQELRLVYIFFFLFMKPWIVCSRQVLYHSAISSAFFMVLGGGGLVFFNLRQDFISSTVQTLSLRSFCHVSQVLALEPCTTMIGLYPLFLEELDVTEKSIKEG